MDPIAVTVNGTKRQVTTDPDRPLLEVLREEWGLLGVHFGCGEEECGACSVLVNGERVFSCSTGIGEVAGKNITTIEGLSKEGKLHPMQEAFLAEGAYQCGYCIPGMIVAAVALLHDTPNPSEGQIRAGMDNNLCRCCGYPKIIRAIQRAAKNGGGQL